MNCWRSGKPETNLEYHRSNTHTAVKEQNEIGWNNFMMGRIGKKWSKTLSNMYKGKKCKQFTCADLVFQIYSIVFNMWDNRNKILHHQKEKHYLLGKEEVDRKIQVQYSLGKYNLIPNNYHLLNTSLQVLMDKTMEQKSQWVSTIEAARKCKLPSTLKGINYSREVMRNFLKKSHAHKKNRRTKATRIGSRRR